MTKEEVLANLQELVAQEEIEMSYEDSDHLWVYDYKDSKDILYNLNMSFRELLSKIFISSRIPKKYRPHKQKLASYLLKHLPHDVFWTLNKIYILWGGEEDFEEMCVDQDEEYWDFDDDVLGLTWFYKNCVFVNIGAILRTEEEIAKEDEAILGWSLSSDRDVREQTVITVVHELRHLMLDTNIVLSEDEYPVNLASEENVEKFARDVVEKHGFDVF